MSEAFERLEKSLREAGKIMRGEMEPSRVFKIEVDTYRNCNAKEKMWAIYMEDEDDALVPGRIYEIEVYGELPQVLVIDDEGESLFCPREWFAPIQIPATLSARLTEVVRTI